MESKGLRGFKEAIQASGQKASLQGGSTGGEAGLGAAEGLGLGWLTVVWVDYVIREYVQGMEGWGWNFEEFQPLTDEQQEAR